MKFRLSETVYACWLAVLGTRKAMKILGGLL